MRHRISSQFISLAGIALLILVLGLTGIFRPLRKLVEKQLIIPLKEEIYDWRRLRVAKEKTTVEDPKLVALKAELAVLREENTAQKRLLSAPLPKNWQFLPARVIEAKGETLTLNLGKSDGVAVGMVAVSGNLYLGRVAQVSEKMAKVNLASFFEEKLPVKILPAADGVPSAQGLLVGRGEGRMRVEQILASEKVAQGDLVMTNLEGGSLLVGEVEEEITLEGEVFKTAEVKRVFVPEELETIFLIRGKI